MGRHLLFTIAAGLTAVVIAFSLLELVLPGHGGASTYATASAAIALATVAAGLRAGLIAAASSCVIAAYLHLPPLGTLFVEDVGEFSGMALFALNGVVVAAAVARVRDPARSMAQGARAGDAARSSSSPPVPVPSVTPAARLTLLHGPSGLVEPLTAREVEVLECLADGMSNEEIAVALFVSVNTIKTHLKNIYGKLAVTSRTKAVARARELALVGTSTSTVREPQRQRAA